MKAQPLGRAVVGLAAAAALATSLAGCAAGRYAETAHEKTTLDGTNVNVHNIALRGLSLAAPSGDHYLAGSDARVIAVLVNNGDTPDRLTGITTTSATGWAAYDTEAVANSVHASANASASLAAEGITPSPTPTAPGKKARRSAATALPAGKQSVRIPPGERVSFGVPDATGGLLLTGMRGKVYPGTTISITFTFARAGSLKVQVPVQISATPGTDTVNG